MLVPEHGKSDFGHPSPPKSEIPNPKSQTNPNTKAANLKPTPWPSFVLFNWFWDWGFVWDFGFRIWDLGRFLSVGVRHAGNFCWFIYAGRHRLAAGAQKKGGKGVGEAIGGLIVLTFPAAAGT